MKVTLCQLLFFILWFINGSNPAQSQNHVSKGAESVGAQSIPIKTQLYDAALYGAVSDGITLNKKAIQKVIGESEILAAKHPEFSFLMPEMAGNLKFGIILPDTSIWLNQMKTSNYKQSGNRISYTLSDPILKGGQLLFEVISLSNTDGIVIEVQGVNVPNEIKLLWSYGGAYGLELEPNQSRGLQPLYCRNNVFSVEWTAFTLYYGQSMRLRVIQGVMPVTSEIKLSDAFVQQSPWAFFHSGKTTIAPALAGVLPLNSNVKEYFCIYKQNEKADYNHYMLPILFEKGKGK